MQHKRERDGRIRDRIKAVLMFDKGWSTAEIAEALLLSEDAIHEHITDYREFKKLKPEDETICFMDEVHPTHNVQPAYGWIKKGVRKEIPANSGRCRLNLSGVIDLDFVQFCSGISERIAGNLFISSFIYSAFGYEFHEEINKLLSASSRSAR